MADFNAENERTKRRYLDWLRDADGKDEKTLDQVASSLHDFEMALGCKPFKAFHRDWGRRYKRHLEKARHHRTKAPLSLATRDARLRHVKAFFKWLAYQPGFKSRISSTDVEYFNNNAKDARAAHAQRPKRFPSLEQCAHAFRLMPEETPLQRRDKAMFALWVMTGARASALATLRIKHVDLIQELVFQDGREVKTKASKTFETWFFPVDPMYLTHLSNWVEELTRKLLFGPGDALFPKQSVGWTTGKFASEGFEREPYSSGQIVGKVIGGAFRAAGLHTFNPHAIRTTLNMFGDRICQTMEQRKAWSQNLGHESLSVSVNAYMPVGRERQGELIRGLNVQ